MIQANELRIGNFISERDNHRIYPLSEISEYGVKVKYWSCGENETISYNKLMPVILTPEILEKCGFNSDGLGCYVKEKLSYQLSENRMHYSFYYAVYNQFNYKIETEHSLNVISHPKFLHQLQNLYFALTGEELKISL